MLDDLLEWLALAAAIGSGLVAGIFLGFSNFIMAALGRLPAPRGAAAMQQINIVVLNPAFLSLFVGTAIAGIAVAVLAIQTRGAGEAALLAGGGLAYAVGTFGVTMRANVPRNNALAALDPESEQAALVWKAYLREWTFWNSVRTWAGALGMVLLLFGWRSLSA